MADQPADRQPEDGQPPDRLSPDRLSPDRLSPDWQPFGEELALQALLYVADALPDRDQADFEARLADDQKARDALTLAVTFVQTCADQEPPLPDPAYRQAVARRLQPPRRWWRTLLHKREHRFHPLVWGGLGAVAAGLLLLASGLLLTPLAEEKPLVVHEPPRGTGQNDGGRAQGGPVQDGRASDAVPEKNSGPGNSLAGANVFGANVIAANAISTEVADAGPADQADAAWIWAGRPRGEHLLKAHEEGVRRRAREQMFQRLNKRAD